MQKMTNFTIHSKVYPSLWLLLLSSNKRLFLSREWDLMSYLKEELNLIKQKVSGMRMHMNLCSIEGCSPRQQC